MLNVQRVKQELEARGIPGAVEITIEPSAVSQSPYDYVYVYLTPDGPEGHHIIVSDAEEWTAEPGIIVGLFPHYEEPALEEQVTVATIAEAVARTYELAEAPR